METQKTALYDYHKSLGAKFVPFAGYEMPVQYSSGIVDEHKLTRSSAGMFDVSHMGQLSITGDENLAIELEKIIPIDLKKIKLNQSKYSFLTNEEGGIYDDLIVTKVEKGFNIILNAACKNNDFKIISSSLKNKFKITLHKNLSLIALQGPKSSQILEKIISGVTSLKFMNGNKFSYNGTDVYITRSGYTGEDGFEISISNDSVDDFAKTLGAKDLNNLKELISIQINDEYNNSLNMISKQQILEQIEKQKLDEIPNNLIDQEFKILSHGMKEEEIKKNKKSLEDQAKKRIKTGLILNAYGEQNGIKVSQEEINGEVQNKLE